MKPITAEWIDKAEGDFASAERECRARKRTNYDAACFHAQQCAEKYIKARLSDAGLSFAKTHDLVSLLDDVIRLEPLWDAFREDLAFLSDYAVMYRYPGNSAEKEAAFNALKRCRRFRTAARASFGLPDASGRPVSKRTRRRHK